MINIRGGAFARLVQRVFAPQSSRCGLHSRPRAQTIALLRGVCGNRGQLTNVLSGFNIYPSSAFHTDVGTSDRDPFGPSTSTTSNVTSATTTNDTGDVRALLRNVWSRREVTLPEMQRICAYYDTFSSKDFDPRYLSGIFGVIRYSGRYQRETLQMIRKSNELLESALNSNKKILPLRLIAEYIGNLRHVSSNIPEVVRFLSLCLDMMRLSPPENNFTANGMSHMIFGMRGMSSEVEVVRDIYAFLASKLSESDALLDAQNISNMLYALQSCSSDAVEVRQFLSALTRKIPSCNNEFLAQHVGNSLYGLNGMSSECAEVRELLIALTPRISECTAPLRGQHIGNAIYGLRSMSSDCPEARDLLEVLCAKIINSRNVMKIQEISMALYGLQSTKCDSQAVRSLLSYLNTQLERCREPMSAQGIGISIYGMQLMSSSELVVQELVDTLRWKVDEFKGKFTPQNASNAIYGLKSMSDKSRPVLDLISALTPKIAECNEFDMRCVSNAIYGLQNMDSFSSEVRGLLVVLRQKLERCDEPIIPQHVGSVLYGLRYMSGSTEEVRLLLITLTAKIISSDITLTGQMLANALYGLQSMSSESNEVLALISALVSKIATDGSTRLSAKEVSNAIYGMQGLTGKSEQEKSLLRALLPILSTCPNQLDEQGVGMGLYGLQRMCDSIPEVADLVAALRCKVMENSNGAELFPHQLSNGFYGLMNMSCSNRDVKSLIDHLLFKAESTIRRIESGASSNIDLEDLHALYRTARLGCHCAVGWDTSSRDQLKSVGDRLDAIIAQRERAPVLKSNFAEHRVFLMLKRALKEGTVLDESIVAVNEFIDRFESDIVIRFPPRGDREALLLNIEIDGPSHEYPSRRLFCERRDSYLHSCLDTLIVRFTLSEIADLTKSNVLDRVLSRASHQYGSDSDLVVSLVDHIKDS